IGEVLAVRISTLAAGDDVASADAVRAERDHHAEDRPRAVGEPGAAQAGVGGVDVELIAGAREPAKPFARIAGRELGEGKALGGDGEAVEEEAEGGIVAEEVGQERLEPDLVAQPPEPLVDVIGAEAAHSRLARLAPQMLERAVERAQADLLA